MAKAPFLGSLGPPVRVEWGMTWLEGHPVRTLWVRDANGLLNARFYFPEARHG